MQTGQVVHEPADDSDTVDRPTRQETGQSSS
jgi:hypothetical protein